MSKKVIKNFQSKKKPEKTEIKGKKKSSSLLALTILVIITFICFSGSLKNEFTNWDDHQYIIENPLVKSLSNENIKEIFTNNVMGNYHPLSMLSFAIDYHFFQLNPKGFHATSIIIHLLNVILVFIFFRMLSGQIIVAFITALLFGIHPMHVESVAWVSERKDVLYMLFYMASLCIYMLFIRSQNRKWIFYAFTIFLFLLSLLSKGQAVTLPVVLLLIDYLSKRKFDKKLLIEKIPFFILSIAFGLIAISAQKEHGAITEIPIFPIIDRFFLASYSFLNYILKLIIPIDLSAFYLYPVKTENLFPIIYYLAPFFLFGMFFFIFRYLRNQKDFIFGFAFFIVNIILLLQLLPVGGSIMSERYTYLSYVGLFFIIGNTFSKTWNSSIKKYSNYKYFFAFALFVFTLFLCYATIVRNKVWKNSETLWTDVIKKNPNTVIAYTNLGSYYQKQGKLDIALSNFNEALNLKPDNIESLINRSDVYRVNGQYELSIADCNKAISTNKNSSGAYMNRGITYCMIGRFDEAFNDFKMVISINPKNSNVYCNRGNLFDMKGQLDSAISDYTNAIFLNPEYAESFYNRGKTFFRKKDYNSAIQDFNSALKLNSKNNDLYIFRSQAFKEKGDFLNALQDALRAKELGNPIDENYLKDLQNLVNK